MFKYIFFVSVVTFAPLSAMQKEAGKPQQLALDAASDKLNAFVIKRVQTEHDSIWPRFVTQAKEFCAADNMAGLDALFSLVIDTDLEEKRILFNLEGIKHTDPERGLLLLARFFKHRELGKKTHSILHVLQECREVLDCQPEKQVTTEEIMRFTKDIIRMYGCGQLEQQTSDGSVKYTCLRSAKTCLKASNLCHICESTILDYISHHVVNPCCSTSIEFGRACDECAIVLKTHLWNDVIILKGAAQALGTQDKK